MEKQMLVELPDELLLKILSLLPMFEDNVATRLISKRWEDSWKLEPDVMFDNKTCKDKTSKSFATFMSFVYGSLLSNDTQILERFHLKLSQKYWASDLSFMVQIAVNRSIRELRINLFGKTLELPSCLSTCKTLKTLILHRLSILVVPTWFRLPSLDTLHLLSVKFSSDETVASLLKACHVLESLVVDQTKEENVMIFNIDVPTLKSLSIDNSKGNKSDYNSKGKRSKKRTYIEGIHGFVIKAPSLTNLYFNDTFSNFIEFEYMPEVIKADIEVICDQSDKFIGSLPSIQHLSLCSLTSKTPYPKDTSFTSLEHLELCTCSAGWANLLACILNDAPKLQSLELKSEHSSNYNDPMILWKEPLDVPKCLSGHLETFEWRQYEGTEQEMNVAEYILANATILKMAKFSARHEKNKYLRSRMLTKVKCLNTASETCQLVFDGVVCL